MKNRIIIIITVTIFFVSLILITRLSKKDAVVAASDVSMAEQSEPIDSSQIDVYLKQSLSLETKGALLEAKDVYQKLMDSSLSSKEMELVQNKLEDLNIKILLSGIKIKASLTYEVKPGDALYDIANKYKTTVEAIALANNIKQNNIRPGMKLRILSGKFSIAVDKSQNILILKFNDEVVKTYPVSTGTNNTTPVGDFKITTKLVDPTWYKDGRAIPASSPENVLGSRWLGFDLPTYGIHGTIEPETIGQQITEGCVRMRNEDVEEMFVLVPRGTEVTVID